jgi:hypothetical protein
MPIHKEPWIFVYFMLALRCDVPILEPLFQYFYSQLSVMDRLIRGMTFLMRELKFVEGKSETFPDRIREWNGPNFKWLSVVITGDGVAYVAYSNVPYWSFQWYRSNENNKYPVIKSTPRTVGSFDEFFKYPTFDTAFEEFKKQVKRFILWHLKTSLGPLFPPD